MVKIHRPDAVFAKVFCIQLAVVLLGALKVVIAALFGSQSSNFHKTTTTTSGGTNATNIIIFLFEITSVSLVSCALAYALIVRYTKIIIPVSYFSVPSLFAIISLHSSIGHGLDGAFRSVAGTITSFLFMLVLSTGQEIMSNLPPRLFKYPSYLYPDPSSH